MSQGGGDRDLFLKRSRDIEYAKQHGHRISTALFNVVICRTDIATAGLVLWWGSDSVEPSAEIG